MIRYRPFLNTDSTFLVEIWQKQPRFRGQISKITRQLLDREVFAKQYFDRYGLILAIDEAESEPIPLGFVHAAFAPNTQQDDLDHSRGIISQLQVVPGEHAMEVGLKLLDAGIEYLRQNDAQTIHAGSHYPDAPFYLGMYGGARIPGVMQKDQFFRDCLAARDFELEEQIEVLDRDLSDFRATIDREQMTLRRQYQIKAVSDPMEQNWWESCTMGLFERERFSVSHKLHLNDCGTVSFWNLQPMATEWGESCRGMYDLDVPPELHRIGMATFLVGESMRHLMLQGVRRVEAQARTSDEEKLAVLQTLGFEAVTQGYLLSRQIG